MYSLAVPKVLLSHSCNHFHALHWQVFKELSTYLASGLIRPPAGELGKFLCCLVLLVARTRFFSLEEYSIAKGHYYGSPVSCFEYLQKLLPSGSFAQLAEHEDLLTQWKLRLLQFIHLDQTPTLQELEAAYPTGVGFYLPPKQPGAGLNLPIIRRLADGKLIVCTMRLQVKNYNGEKDITEKQVARTCAPRNPDEMISISVLVNVGRRPIFNLTQTLKRPTRQTSAPTSAAGARFLFSFGVKDIDGTSLQSPS